MSGRRSARRSWPRQLPSTRDGDPSLRPNGSIVVSGLKYVLQCELQDSWIAGRRHQTAGLRTADIAGDLPEIRRVQRRHRRAQIHAVQNVEGFAANLYRLLLPDAEGPRHRDIE